MLWKERKYAWFLLAFLWCFGFAGSLSRFVISYYQGEITASLGVGRNFLGTTWSTATFIGALCAPLGGLLVDRYGVKKVMLLVSSFQILSITAVITMRNELGYFIGNGLFAGFVGLGASTSYVLITGWFKHHRAKALAVLGSSTSLGFAVMVPILANWQGLNWIKVYEILLLVSLIFIPCIVFILREHTDREIVADEKDAMNEAPTHDSAAKPLLKWLNTVRIFTNMLRHPVYLIVAFGIFTCGISMGTVEMNLVAIHQTAHVSTGMISSAMSLLGLLEVFGGITFSILLDHTSRTKALAILYLLRTAAFTFLILHFPVSPILFSLLFGATYVGAVPGAILVARESLADGDKNMGLHTGILLLVHQLGGVLAALAGGFNFDLAHNYQLLIGFNLLLSLSVSTLYFKVQSRHKRSEAAAESLAQ
ncbi:MFS transporter [Paenibacillus sp. HJL G12]|uniref:MFS transporter n=1 Tax=Paenibacillus dendrobii TaxID=2691084 RepID=A0A7X3IEK8_9BACL|nr:MFS transporter [Paenibacillus dendrobii]MWV42430.1 MFS transporter [Paenibacillus dendrobii]